MKKFIVETYYTCTFKTVHTLDNLNDKELSKIEKQNKKKTKCPSDLSKNHEIGYIMTSDNDNNVYKVMLVKGPKRTMKRWVRVK